MKNADVPKYIIEACSDKYSYHRHICNMKSPVFASTVSYLQLVEGGVELFPESFAYDEDGEGIIEIPMCTCNFRDANLLQLIPTFLIAGYYVTVIGNESEICVTVYNKINKVTCIESVWNWQIIAFPTDPIHTLGRNLFKTILRLQKWKWRALSKGYAPPEGRLFLSHKRKFGELVAETLP